jgi:hypothetical protein
MLVNSVLELEMAHHYPELRDAIAEKTHKRIESIFQTLCCKRVKPMELSDRSGPQLAWHTLGSAC